MINDDVSKSWYVDINNVRTDYPRAENLAQFLVKEVPLLPKYHPTYVKFWSREAKRCIEGTWGRMFGKWRYMPGNLYFFGNYGVIEDTKIIEGVPVTKHYKPRIVDYFWEFAAMSWAAYGFSGFEKDDEYSCHRSILDYEKGDIKKELLPESCISSTGEVKKYVEAIEYLLKLHDKPMGKSWFLNESRDVIVMGSRSGGKSYWVGIGELEYNFVFSGARRYDRKYIDNKLKCRQVVGSADTTKSAELYDKFLQSQNAKTNNKDSDYVKWFGVYTEAYYDSKGNKQEKITPCPFYRHTVGNLDCPNKLNPLKAVYKVKRNGEYQKEGVGSELVHVNYSTKKGDGAQAAVGGRYLFSDVEEVGLVQNYIEVLGSNKSALRRNGRKNGVSWSQGTSGNITYVQEAKKVFLNPGDYDTIAFKSKFNKAGKEETTGYFIPNYMVHFAYKDKDGNTNYEEAIDKINKERRKSAESKDPNVLRDHLMNEPCYIDEMWITNKGDYFHNQELTLRERQLTTGNKYQELETCVKLFYNPEKPRGIGYEILHDAEPYRQFPHDTAKMKNPEGCVVIYDFPQEINGEIPPDMYVFIGHDPHGDGKEPGSSVASTYVLMNPKYAGSPYNLRGNTIVASWNGKPKGGLDEYYEIQEKLIQFYGSPPMSLMYERNKGADCRAHYIKKHKVHLLAPTPQFGQGTSMDYKNIRDFGYYTGAANFGKASMAKHIDDWSIEWTELDDKYPDGGKRQNWERLPCLYLIRQMMQYNLEDNFDAVDGFRGCILGLREHTIRIQADTKKTNKPTTTFQGILNNNRIFQQRLNATKK